MLKFNGLNYRIAFNNIIKTEEQRKTRNCPKFLDPTSSLCYWYKKGNGPPFFFSK